jgi:hypothetical protein
MNRQDWNLLFTGRTEIKMRVRCDSMHSLQSYADAKYEWETTDPWRGDTSGEKPLDDRRKHHMTIRIGDAGEVRCKLYRTDVVVYWPNGEIELCPYNTGSTNEFANTLLPNGAKVDFVKGVVLLNFRGWWEPDENTRVYRCNDNFRIKKTGDLWVLAEDQKILQWKRPTVNRARAKIALAKYDFARLQAWVIGFDGLRLADLEKGDEVSRITEWDLPEFMRAGPHEWKDYAWRVGVKSSGWGREAPSRWNGWKGDTAVSPQIEHIRMLIYRMEKVVDVLKLDYLTSWKEMRSLLKTQQKFSWA